MHVSNRTPPLKTLLHFSSVIQMLSDQRCSDNQGSTIPRAQYIIRERACNSHSDSIDGEMKCY